MSAASGGFGPDRYAARLVVAGMWTTDYSPQTGGRSMGGDWCDVRAPGGDDFVPRGALSA